MRRISAKARSMRPIILFSFLMVITTSVSCGGGATDLHHSSEVVVTIAPSTAVIRVGGTIDLQGTVTGLSDPWILWWIQEQHDAGANLTDVSHSASGFATYHAPAAAGTYHVTFRATKMSGVDIFEFFEKRTTATIIVTN